MDLAVPGHGRFPRRRRLRPLVASLAMLGVALTGCSTHDVAATRTCTTVANGGRAVAASTRGHVGLAKIGLTPKGLKVQEKCK